MPKKSKPSPKVKHKPFASFCTRLQDDDWMIGVFNTNDKTAAYFLAEPIAANPMQGSPAITKKSAGVSFIVSALSRQGLVENTIKGLPRKFKNVEDAMECLEGQVEDYEGDLIEENLYLDNKFDVDFKFSGQTSRHNNKLVGEVVHKEVENIKNKANTGVKSVTSAETKKPKIKPRGKNGTKSTKTAKSDEPYVKPVNKFKTSKQELESFGLGGLFDD